MVASFVRTGENRKLPTPVAGIAVAGLRRAVQVCQWHEYCPSLPRPFHFLYHEPRGAKGAAPRHRFWNRMIMQWLGTAFNGAPLQAMDGTVGELADLLFDDRTWQIRWLLVDSGRWLSGRKILIHPSSLQQPESDTATLRVQLTRSQIRNSPPIDSDAPISMQMERSLSKYYGYDPDANGAWSRGSGIAPHPVADSRPSDRSVAGMVARQRRKLEEPHLRSVAEVEGYLIRARDGDAGLLKNVVIDDEAWRVHGIVVDVPTWWSVKHVVVPATSVERISWSERYIRLDMTREKIKASELLNQAAMMGSPYAVLMGVYRAWKSQARLATGGE